MPGAYYSGETQFVAEPPSTAIRFVCADADGYLEACQAASFDAFSLSNIAVGAPSCCVQRLCRAVNHAATLGAVLVARTFAEAHLAPLTT
jgi:hypothetical protein